MRAPASTRISQLTYGESERLMKLHEIKSRTKYVDRPFSHDGPKLWNVLPQHLREGT